MANEKTNKPTAADEAWIPAVILIACIASAVIVVLAVFGVLIEAAKFLSTP